MRSGVLGTVVTVSDVVHTGCRRPLPRLRRQQQRRCCRGSSSLLRGRGETGGRPSRSLFRNNNANTRGGGGMRIWRRSLWRCCVWCAAAIAAMVAAAAAASESAADRSVQRAVDDTPLSFSSLCPTKCLCVGTTVECARLQISSVPLDIATNATVLDLSQNNFSTLGDGSFVNYPQLEELNLASNNLINVSTNVFADLTKLHLLNLNGNNLSAVPWRALLDLPELQELYLGDNRIEFIFVGDFQGLLELTTLALEGNLIEFIPVEALQGLLNLKILSLAKNRLSKISDDSFQNLTSLEVLSLASNNIASITPNAFLGLLSLEILELQRNQLHVIPDAIKNLPSLRKLSVAFNHIKYIGEETFRCNSMLAHADLLGNPVILIEHRVFTNLTQLKILIIPEAKELTSFPDLNGTRSLEFLRIERAHLRHVPDDLCHVSYNLKTLDFKSNALEEVPLLTACTELRQLQLSGNQIRSLEGALFRTQHLLHDLLLGNNLIDRILADAFIGLHKLEILNLVGNRITMIHHDAFLPLKQLNYLNVAENRFPQLPSRGLEHVRQLLAFNNPWLRDFPPPSSLPHAHTLKLAYAYHCCQFSSTSGVSSDAASSRSGLLSSGLTETVVWVPKEKVDLSLWATNTSKDLWPVYQNLTHKFGEFADDLWGTMNPDYAYPSNMPQVIEDYMEETRVNEDQRPGHVVSCSPQPGPFMPCEDLFDWWTLRCGIWVVFLLAMLGNGAVVFVLVFSRTKMDVPRFLVCNLACADFCMGVYLGFLAVVDASTLGHFKRHALQWQFSAACQTAGFLGVLSSELSVYTLAVITLERNYAITHAMHLNKRLSLRHAAYIMAGGWAFATFTAALPFFGVSDYRKFAVCLPFDIDAPWSLAYVVFLMAVNGVAFLILMGCYLKMYCAIRGSQAWNSNDSRIAKRMALLVFTDFVCWAPIAFFSLTAAFGLQLVTLEEAKVFTIFVLPLNSCANPFLYAILTKQFKKDCVLICKAIEESRVTRGIGRCRHSSNFSNRQTPANTNSAVVGDRHSLNGQLACSCSRGSSDGGPRRGGPVVGSASAAASAAGLTATQRGRSERHRRWRLSKVRFLLCAAAEDIDEPDSACNEYAYAIAEIQKGQQGGGKHGRHLSVSSDNFSSSRSDSWRQKSIPLRLLDKQGRRGSWTIQRKASQDSNLSSSRNDSSATTPSTSTWRVSRSSVSSDMSTGGGGGGASAQRSATAAALVNLRERASSAAAAGMSSSSAGTGVSSPGTPNGDLPPPTSSVVRFALPQDGKDGSSPPPPLTSARPKGKLRRQSAIMEDPGSLPPPSLPLVPQDDRPVAFTGCSVQVTKEVPGDADRDCRRGGADRPSSRHLFAGGWTDALRRHQLMDGGFFPRKLSTISSNSCSLNQESWGAAMQCLGSGGGSGSSSHVLQSRVSADETLRKRLEPSLTGPSERCTSLTNVAKPTPPDPRRAWSDASFHGRSPHPPNDEVWPTWSTDPQKDQTQRSQSDQQLQTQRGRTIWEWSVPIGDLAMGEEAEEEEEVVDIEDLGTCRGLAAEESDPLVGEHRTSTRPRYLEDDV